MARACSLAEHYRDHRRVMLLAQELGCTPNEAKAELARREARARWQETEHRLRTKAMPADAVSDDRWMMRD